MGRTEFHPDSEWQVVQPTEVNKTSPFWILSLVVSLLLFWELHPEIKNTIRKIRLFFAIELICILFGSSVSNKCCQLLTSVIHETFTGFL